MENAFARQTDQVLSTLGVQASTGLTDAQVTTLRKKHGKNGMQYPPFATSTEKIY